MLVKETTQHSGGTVPLQAGLEALHKSGCGNSSFDSIVMAGQDDPVQLRGLVADRDVPGERHAEARLDFVVHDFVVLDVYLEETEVEVVDDALAVGPLHYHLDAPLELYFLQM